jgi:ATP-dependent Clp protease protease subunit
MYLNSIGEKDIKKFINSPGGSVIDGLSIYDVMNYVTPDVSTYCIGMCASMGSILLSSGAKGKRYSLPNGEVMIHQVSGGAQGQFSDMEIAVKHAGRLQDKLYNILAENTGKPFEQIQKDADRDNWFTAQEALDYGLIDEIIKTAR